jgi:fructokinase
MKFPIDFSVIGIGEILWDLLPEGKKLGGAPANFAVHARQMGLNAGIISAVGNDNLGTEILRIIREKKLVDMIQTNNKSTGTVSVSLSEDGIPDYVIHEEVAWDFIEPDTQALDFVKKAHAICFGSLAQRSEKSRNSIRKILTSVPTGAIKVFDINIRQNFYDPDLIQQSLGLANILKINDEELALLKELLEMTGNEFDIISQLLDSYQLDSLALTKGSRGSWLFSQQNSSYIETPKVKVADTVGAGDSFTAAMVAGILADLPFEEVHQFAVDVSAYVCTREGASPALPADLLSRLYW